MNAVHANVMTIDTARKVLSVVDHGLCFGRGEPIPGQMGVEAAVCYALGLPHGADPKCVDLALRLFVDALNDSPWSGPHARAKGMRRLAVAQLGSLGQIDSIKFAKRLAEQTIRRLLPPMLRQIGLNDVADRCEQEGTKEAANAAANAALAAHSALAANAAYAAALAAARYVALDPNADDAAVAATNVAYATHAAHFAALCVAACYAGDAANTARDGVLTLMGDICVDVLRDIGAPGITLMDQVC